MGGQAGNEGRGRAGLIAAVVVAAVLVVVAAPMAVIGLAISATAISLAGCAVGGTAQQVAGIDLDAEQMGNAATITTVAADRSLPARAAVIAVATAYQESRLYNLDHGDRDSLGLFQQRPSSGWGTPTQVRDPVYATNAFLDHLVKVPGWQQLPLTVAAQTVQRSAFPSAYARWEALATGAVGQLWPTAAAAAGGAGVAVLCPDGPVATSGGTGNTVAGTRTVPTGLLIAGSAPGQAAVRFALAQLGKPYLWGGAGPGAYDCSGLVMAAWARAGVALPHWTGAQVTRGTPAPTDLSTATAGDLVFIPGSDGTAERPGHVGMVAGWVPEPDGRHIWLIQAPMTGLDVRLTEATQWAGKVVAVRHIA